MDGDDATTANDAGSADPPVTTIADLQRHLQAAVALELSTIPVYLCGWWSIRDGNDRCAALVNSVLVDEMKHLTIAANCLIATGGSPDILAAAPSYPGLLPDGETELHVHLLPFGPRFLAQAMHIESPEPAAPLCAALGPPGAARRVARSRPTLGMGDRYVTIGEFYQAILDGIDHLVGELGEAAVFPDGGNMANQVKSFNLTVPDSRTARAWLTNIVLEGEGDTRGLWDERGKLAHFYVFQQMALGREYQRGDQPGKPTGATLDVPPPDGVFQMTPDPRMSGYPAGSKASTDAAQFNDDYTTLLEQLQTAFTGQPDSIDDALEQMSSLTGHARVLLRDTVPDAPGVVPGPTFETCR